MVGLTILCYHAVGDDWPAPLTVPAETFAAHCEWLERARGVRPLDDLLSAAPAHGGPVALTFDDASADLYDNAFPVLRSRQLPATVFVVARTLMSDAPVVDWVDGVAAGVLKTLSSAQVLEMHEGGVSFASHSFAHRDLPALTEAECVEDLRLSREAIEDLLHEAVRVVAYPRGRHAAHVRRAAARAGYTHAVSLPRGGREAGGPYAVPRVGVFTGNDLRALRVKTSRFYLPVRMSRAFPVVAALRRKRGQPAS